MDKLFNRLRNLDAYPKVNEDFYSRTLSGGVITLVSSIFIALLFISEFRLYLHTVTDTKLAVDSSRGGKLRINFDVSFPRVPCSLLSLDAMDISGERHLDISHDIFKNRINSHGVVIETRQDGIGAPKIERPLQKHGGRLEENEKYCGSCYGAETSDDHCCNTCGEVREAYRNKGWGLTNADLIDQCSREGFVQQVKEEEGEGCNIHGSLEVNKVAGNFHFATGKSFHQSSGAFMLLDLLALQTETYNVRNSFPISDRTSYPVVSSPSIKYNPLGWIFIRGSILDAVILHWLHHAMQITHKINKLSFGDSIPGIVNPLDRVEWVQKDPNGVYQYFTKVVPTVYTNSRGYTIHSNQFSVTEHYKSAEDDHFRSPPGVFFYYDLSPIKVTFTEEHTPFLHFLTHICAIVGGTFTVAGIVSSFIYHGNRAIRKKVEIGKLR